ncbi:Predicted DNA binding protein, contains HTH domain [Halogranum gelatinilyticum]|uniref:Predicted DNA binding protein, contains HTH domain n=1 Tax=Halogranum gelatinilyticum TaxID=660521 RepID=A0A1G9YU27_9EURY|nr:histidine kinase N-terminal 7TM domain-containing protein [Halogranum gelatinilyticum]SDN11933.1 Predicted DNA binding protein, contains HTH domain [Halogranum gelatinilyticum]
MGFATTLVHVTLLSTSAVLTAWLAVVGWRRRDRPAAKPFVGLMVVATIWSLAYAGGLLTPTRGGRVLWEQLQWIGIAFVPLFLVLFFAEYTGFETLRRPLTMSVLSVVPTLTLCLVWTNSWHHLIWTDTVLVRANGVVIAHQEFGPWYWVNLLYTYLLTGGGLFLLLHAVRESRSLLAPPQSLLAVGIGLPFVVNLASVLGYQPIDGLDMTPYVFGLTGLAFSRAIFGYDLFDRPPSVLKLGRLSALEHVGDAIVVTDTGDSVVYHNPAATEVLGNRTSTGRDIDDFLHPVPVPGDEPVVSHIADRIFEIQSATIADSGGHAVGTMYRFHDVTDREERLAELERRQTELIELDEINRILRNVGQVLVSSRTTAAVEAGVANQLRTTSRYTDATVVDEAVRETQYDADEETAQLTVPVRFGTTVYGSLRVRTDRRGGFPEPEVELLEELAETVGMALNAVETRQTLVSDTVVELGYDIGPAGSPLAAVTQDGDAELAVTSTVPLDASAVLAYVDVIGSEPETVVSDLDARPTVEAASRVPNRSTIELHLDGTTPLAIAIAHGANVVDSVASDGSERLVVETASGSSVRTLTDALHQTAGDVKLASKQQRAPVEPAQPEPSTVDAGLTPRQRESVDAAYDAGYFEWPRDSTAEDVAAAMDIAPSTFHSHLRKAQGKLMTWYVERRDGS